MPKKYKRAVRKISSSLREQGKSPKEAKRIAHATATKHNIGGVKEVRKREHRQRKSARRKS